MFDMYDLDIRKPIKHTSIHSPYSQKLGGNKKYYKWHTSE